MASIFFMVLPRVEVRPFPGNANGIVTPAGEINVTAVRERRSSTIAVRYAANRPLT
jgi:hypothetical protein